MDYRNRLDTAKTKNHERLWSVVLACLAPAFGAFSVGYGVGYSSAAVIQLSNSNTTELYIDENGISWFVVRFVLPIFVTQFSVYVTL